MSKAQRKTKGLKLVIPESQPSVVAENHPAITKDDVAQRAYELFLARGRVAGEFILTPPLVFRTGRDNAAASDRT